MFVSQQGGATAKSQFHYVAADAASLRGCDQRPGAPDAYLRPWGISVRDGRVVYLDLRNPPGKRHKALLEYDATIQLERRKLAETALATIVLHNPHLVGAVLHKVSAGITGYWQKRREQLGKSPAPATPPAPRGYYTKQPLSTAPPPQTDPIAWQALQGTSTYTHGPTSYGRLDTAFPTRIDQGVRQQLAALYGNSIPQTINAHDNFLRIFGMIGPTDLSPTDAKYKEWLAKPRDPGAKILQDHWTAVSLDMQRLKALQVTLRPGYLFDLNNPEMRGRLKVAALDPAANTSPGLLPNAMPAYLDAGWKRLRADWFGGRTLPVETEARRRGLEMYSPATTSVFIQEVVANNLMFAAGQSGTTSTLFQSALFFGRLSGDDLKTYLMAVIGYLVAGGMHSCHEIFKTAELVGIPYIVGAYQKAIPPHILKHPLYIQWTEEFADLVGEARYR